MKIILIKDVPNLGKRGQIKEVADGFARNFLIPKNLAVLPNDPRAQVITQEKTTHQAKEKQKQQELNKVAARLDDKTFNFVVKADKKDHLYGSIGPKELSAKIGVDENLIHEHFKTLGTFPLEIKINPDKPTKIKIVIEKEK